ncbi:MAG: MFS transporter [Fimbriimonadaceae bacterium]|nr:MFS transporter [Fimbriimonadaceae bacterium]
MRRPPPIVAIFLTVMLDMLSFSIVIPDVQIRVEAMTHGSHSPALAGVLNGLTLAVFSIAQFLVSPYLGRLSDRIGRRPVLMVTCSMAVVASVLYAYATSLPVIWLSRICLGTAAANMGVAQAYISDVSAAEERAKAMGLLGMAFGIGFIFGPPLGAWLLQVGHGTPLALGWVSASFALVNLAFIVFALPESRRAAQPSSQQATGRMAALRNAFGHPQLAQLLALFFVANLAFTNLESTFYLLGKDVYKISVAETTVVLVVVGIVAAVTQGGLIRLLVPRFGELTLVRAGYLLTGPTLFAMPLVPPLWPILLGASIMGIGNGVAGPSVLSLISQAADQEVVGEVMGVTGSLGAMARIIGPVVANALYKVGPVWPYFLAGTMMLVPLTMAWRYRKPPEPQAELV